MLALVRGDDRLERDEAPRGARRGRSGRPTDEEIREAFGAGRRLARARSASTVEVIADEALREGQFVAGANRDGWHLRGVEAGRDYEPRFADLREAARRRPLPRLRRRASLPDGDRGRTHLQARHAATRRRSEATFLDEDGTEKPLVMGSYGIGPAG